MSYRSEKIKKALETKGYTNVKAWYEPLGVALEMCGPSGGWLYSSDQRNEDWLGYNVEEALEAVKQMDNRHDDEVCVCGHKRFSHTENGCLVFINEQIGDCPCQLFNEDV